MKRRLFKLVVFLLLGAIVNVAVAWGCAALSPLDRDPVLFEEYAESRAVVWNGFGYRLLDLGLGRDGPTYAVVESGWPLYCLEAYGRWKRRPIATPRLRIDRKLDLWLVGPDQLDLDQRTIPLRPIWPGFAINTAFYAAILWLLTLGPFTLRRVIRRKRGCCIKCGYDLRGDFSGGCPECGWRREAVP